MISPRLTSADSATGRPIDNPDPLRFQRAFAVRSHVQVMPYDEMLGQRPGDADWGTEVWDHYTEAPRDPRYAELANQVLDTLIPEYRGDPLGRALAVKEFLDREGTYCRRSKHASSGDPAASFLFGDLTGYCVHFAHASVYLLRSLGVPARVAAGYAVGEESRGTGSAVLIRGADAHAWPEIYLEGVGWVVVDLTPAQQCDEESYQDADPELQRMLGEMMRNQRWQDDTEDRNRERWTLAKLASWFALLLALLLALAWTGKLYRYLAPHLGPQHQQHRLTYREALDRLADVGLRRRFGESREAFARRVSSELPSFPDLTALHLGASLGSRRAAAPGTLSSLRGRVGVEIRNRIPGWRRYLGVLDPVSWMTVR